MIGVGYSLHMIRQTNGFTTPIWEGGRFPIGWQFISRKSNSFINSHIVSSHFNLAKMLSQERCVFPYSNNAIFAPIRDFPWHEERFGNHYLFSYFQITIK